MAYLPERGGDEDFRLLEDDVDVWIGWQDGHLPKRWVGMRERSMCE